jgi:hypothetical protein
MEYEFTVFLDLSLEHVASASKDRTRLFDGTYFKPAAETGKKLLDWLESGIDAPELLPSSEQIKKTAELVTMEQAKSLQAAAIEKYGDNHAALFAELTGYKKFGMVPAGEYERMMKAIRSDGK